MTQAGMIWDRRIHEPRTGARSRGRSPERHLGVRCVLFEMLSSERVFAGRDVHETLAAVTAGEIAWSRLPPQTPPQLRQLLARCLDRDAARRLRDIGEARITLDDLIDGTATLPTPAVPGPTRSALLLVAATAALASGVIAVALWPRPASPAAPVTRFALTPPADRQLLVDPQSIDLAITRDGTRIVYKGGARVDRTQLFVIASTARIRTSDADRHTARAVYLARWPVDRVYR